MNAQQVVEQSAGFLVVASPLDQVRALPDLAQASPGDHRVLEAGSSRFDVWCSPGIRTSSPDWRVELLLRGELYGQAFGEDRQRVIEAYAQQGAGVVESLNGSFSLILIDTRDGTLIAATDRLNSRKIYYAESANAVTFASSIFLHPARPLTVDRAAVACYLANGAMHNNRTPFNEISVMERASVYRYSDGRLSRRAYWKHRFSGEYAGKPYKQLKQELGEILVEAVRIRIPQTSPPLISLSAGYDATGILGIIGSRLRIPEAHCFSYAFGQAAPLSDESLSRKMAALVGYPFRIIPSFAGSLGTVIERNARLGQGTSHFCHEVDAWFELGNHASCTHEHLFVGDECVGWIDRPLRSHADVLQAISVYDFSHLRWLEDYLGGASVRRFAEAVQDDISAMLGRCPESDDLHDTKDYLYLDQRLNHVIMPWRENFPGRFFTVANPLLDNTILDFMRKVPSPLRRGKRLFKDTVRDMFPTLFRIRRAQSSSFTAYWEQVLPERKGEVAALLEETASPLDALIPPEVFVRILQDYLYVPPRRRLRDLPKSALKRVVYGSAWYDWATSKVRVPRPGPLSKPKVLERGLVLRTFLAGIAAESRTWRG